MVTLTGQQHCQGRQAETLTHDLTYLLTTAAAAAAVRGGRGGIGVDGSQ